MAKRGWIICYDFGHATKPGHCECLRCGHHSVTMAAGMTISVVVAAMKAFEGEHKDCAEGAAS